ANDLQNSLDKRVIEPDAKLSAVFGGTEPIKMFEMTKRVSAHIGKAGE
ncbi:MAG: SWIB/MDM2 domain-containing protein, partial [Chlamydiia bacterium]|nr:SWIB/MDM2 domain-containing protein [Chlamydiia bacterium]